MWETTHLGGHRFAPTAVVLPSGLTYGRLTPDAAVEVFEQAGQGRFTAGTYRGLSTFTRPGQAAEAAVRQATVEEFVDHLDVVTVEPGAESWHAVVAHRDGRRWDVDVLEQSSNHRARNRAAAPQPRRSRTPPDRLAFSRAPSARLDT